MNAVLVVAAVLGFDPAATLVSARGQVELVRGASPAAAVQQNARVLAGDRFVLGADGRLALRAGAALFQAATTGEVVVESEQRLRFRGERLRVANEKDVVQVLVGAAAVQVGAADVRIRRTPAGQVVEALTGEPVTIVGPAGVVTLRPGTGGFIGGSAEPVALAGAPRLLYPAAHAPLTAFRFRWRQAPQVTAYRLEIAADPGFDDILFVAESPRAGFESPAQSLPLGLLYWRVTPRTGDFEGLPSEGRAFRVAP